MGQLINGIWTNQDQFTNKAGEFQRTVSAFQGHLPLQPKDLSRYILIASKACPWAHRVILTLKLFAFNEIEIHYAPPQLGEEGWRLPESLTQQFKKTWVHQLYQQSYPTYSGRVTLPLLWDQEQQCIISNDSSELLIHLVTHWLQNRDHNTLVTQLPLFTHQHNHHDWDEILYWQRWITTHISNGPYRAIFSEHQTQYETNVVRFFEALDMVESRLSQTEFFMGDQVTICDLSLFPTLYRLEIAYKTHLKCSWKTLADYAALSRYTNQFSQIPEIVSTLAPHEIDIHYRLSVPKKNHQRLEYHASIISS